jgi:DNA primase
MATMPLYKNSDDWDDFKQRLQQLKESIDPRFLLESLGFKITRETTKELRCACNVHGGDNKTSFRFNKQTLSWMCFSHRCNEVYGSDVIGLIMSTMKIGFKDAVEHLQSLCGETNAFMSQLEYKRKKEKEDFIRRNSDEQEKPSYVNEDSLKRFSRYRSRLFGIEKFDNAVLDFFEIGGGYTDSFGLIRDIIPIRDADTELVAYSMRDIRPNAPDDDFKYILTKGFVKDKVLYNLHRVIEEAQTKPLIVVEGFKSVWRMYQYGITNSVAVMGNNITPGQVNLLCSYALKGVITMFDNDVAGVRGTLEAVSSLSDKMKVIPVFITEVDEKTGKGLDPADLDRETIYKYLGKGD